jgi:hypothetical protein
MGNPVSLDSILEGLGYMGLTNDLFKGLGAVFSCQYEIGHVKRFLLLTFLICLWSDGTTEYSITPLLRRKTLAQLVGTALMSFLGYPSGRSERPTLVGKSQTV